MLVARPVGCLRQRPSVRARLSALHRGFSVPGAVLRGTGYGHRARHPAQAFASLHPHTVQPQAAEPRVVGRGRTPQDLPSPCVARHVRGRRTLSHLQKMLFISSSVSIDASDSGVCSLLVLSFFSFLSLPRVPSFFLLPLSPFFLRPSPASLLWHDVHPFSPTSFLCYSPFPRFPLLAPSPIHYSFR